MGCFNSKHKQKPSPECPYWDCLYNCRCLGNGISFLPDDTSLYHQSGLICRHGRLWRSVFAFDFAGLHYVPMITSVTMEHAWIEGRLIVWLVTRGPSKTFHLLEFIGLWRVKRIQRWMRRMLDNKHNRRALALAMGLHCRLGQASGLMDLGDDLVCMCMAMARC